MESDETSVYIPVEDVADLLGVSQRQATRYAKKVRTQQDGRRYLYHRGDVEQLAQERDVKHDRPLAVHTEVLPPGRLLDILTQQQNELIRLSRENERLNIQQQQAEQDRQKLLEDKDETSRQVSQAEERAKSAEAEAERLRLELERLRRSWWRRIFSK